MKPLKNFSKHQWKQMKEKIAQLSNQDKAKEESAPVFEIDPETYRKLKRFAEQDNTDIESLLQQAIQSFIEHRTASFVPISEEHLARNPLLKLDAIVKEVNS